MRSINNRNSNRGDFDKIVDVGQGIASVFDGSKRVKDPNINHDKKNKRAMNRYMAKVGIGGLGRPCNMTPRRNT